MVTDAKASVTDENSGAQGCKHLSLSWSRQQRYLRRSYSMLAASAVNAGPREQAKRLHDRLVGIPPSAAVTDSMSASIAAGDGLGAAYQAMENPAFYNTTLREYATPWTNREQSVYVDMNDSVATVIGMIRDEVPFDQLLYEDIVYVGTPGATAIAYSQTDNDHYLDLQLNRIDLSDAANLVRQQQSELPASPIGINEAAGILTTRALCTGIPRRWNQPCRDSFCNAQFSLQGHGRPARPDSTPGPDPPGCLALARW